MGHSGRGRCEAETVKNVDHTTKDRLRPRSAVLVRARVLLSQQQEGEKEGTPSPS